LAGEGQAMKPSALRYLARLTPGQRKLVAELEPELSGRLRLADRYPRDVGLTAAEWQAVRRKAESAFGKAGGPARTPAREVLVAAGRAIHWAGRTARPRSELAYQFKITLLESQPPIWRRIQVADCTLDSLHEHIQTAMGWTNSHLHDFKIGGRAYGDPLLMQ